MTYHADKVIAAILCDGLQLMIRKPSAQNRPRRLAGAVKFIVRISHSVYTENSFQTALVERAVVGDERQVPYECTDLFPYLGESRCKIFHIWYPSLRLFMQRYRYNSLYPAYDKGISPPLHQVPCGGRHLPAIYHCVRRKT